MTDTERGLLEAVCRNPDSNECRLIYAEWLDERGEGTDRERAAFIRLQIANDHNPEIGFVWSPEWPGGNVPGVEFRRGFPDRIECRMDEFLGGESCFCGVSLDSVEFEHRRVPTSHYYAEYHFSYILPDKDKPPCPSCHGTGRREGLADVAARELWPITKVVLVDREPLLQGGRWVWWRLVTDFHGPEVLPKELWGRLSEHFVFGGEPHLLKWYETPTLALAAASDACVRVIGERRKQFIAKVAA